MHGPLWKHIPLAYTDTQGHQTGHEGDLQDAEDDAQNANTEGWHISLPMLSLYTVVLRHASAPSGQQKCAGEDQRLSS